MLRILLSALLALFSTSIIAQDYWEQIDQSDGLIGNEVYHFVEESQTKWWVSTSFGVSLIQNGVVYNYPIPNLNPAVVFDMEFTQGKLWIATTNGLYSFDGNFQNYGLTDGFKTVEINDLATASNGDLWIATDSSVSMYDGQNFVHYDSLSAQYVLIDGSDRVYTYRFDILLNFPNFNYVFDNNQWVDYGGLISKLYDGTDFIEDNGEIYLVGAQDSNGVYGMYEINYPNTPIFHRLEFESGFTFGYKNRIVKNQNKIYVASNRQLFVSNDSILSQTNLNVANSPEINRLAESSSKLMLCTKDGLLFSNKSSIRAIAKDSLDVNNVISKVFEFGPPFSSTLDRRAGGFGFPKNNPTYTTYVADFMFSGRDSASMIYRSTDVPFFTEWNNGPVSNVRAMNKNYMVKIQKQEVLNHIANYNQTGYNMPYSIRNWPALGDSSLGIAADLAPFIDVNQNGCYDPQNGDYPYMKGDEAIYWIRNYPDSSLKLEYHYMLYAYNSSQIPELNQAQFLECRIVNRGPGSYDRVKLGLYFDGDMGNPSDDYVGSDSVNSITYFYNGDNFDEAFQGQPGFGANSPAVGVKYLSDSMTNAAYFNIGGTSTQPSFAIEWFNLFNSILSNGVPITYDYFGWNSTQKANIMYAGDPLSQTGWTERTPGSGLQANFPGDRRSVSSFEEFTLGSGESKIVEVVMGYGRKDSTNSHLENISEMVRVLNRVGDYWDSIPAHNFTYGSNYNCPAAVGLADLKVADAQLRIYPNPANEILNIESDLLMSEVQLYSISGALVRDLRASSKRMRIDLSDMNKGLYILRISDEQGRWTSRKLIVE